jgi:DNA-binding MarR family transcriptional regulator
VESYAGGRPAGLAAWAELSGLVDQVRILLNRDLQAAAGLTLAENLVLCQVAMAPEGRLRMAGIASALTIAKSAVTKTVDRLEERGLLRRERDPADRRTVYAALTPAGEKAFAVAQPAYLASVERHFASYLSDTAMHQFRQLSNRVRTSARPDPPGAAGT